ncbi:Protein CBG16966 [Caenorhabditis briggsae]|uniref:Protein CBG16966 n=1 Tax=Caenorhabditis briggsae TaxID=6238 RepID=A8XQ57_CAEBR|nr:Protein CBG16966 [Caenorhabditis briggsae]CAP34783.2 Protein CBG16966 [Caenorhabditis briggsae]
MNTELNEKLIVFIDGIAENVFWVQFIISTIGLIMNIPHLFILLHNSMRTSSTNSIMIGISICDLIVLSENVYERVQSYWFYGSQYPCINNFKFWYLYSLLIGDFLRDIFEETSFWLGVFLAFTRLVIMKAAGTTLKISKPIFGYFLILLLVGLSSIHSAHYYHGFRTKKGCQSQFPHLAILHYQPLSSIYNYGFMFSPRKLSSFFSSHRSLKVGGHEKNNVLEIPFKDASRGVELVKAMIEGAAPLPTEPRGQRESARPIAYIKARTTAVRRVILSVVHRDGRMHTLATKKLRKISCPPTFKRLLSAKIANSDCEILLATFI